MLKQGEKNITPPLNTNHTHSHGGLAGWFFSSETSAWKRAKVSSSKWLFAKSEIKGQSSQGHSLGGAQKCIEFFDTKNSALRAMISNGRITSTGRASSSEKKGRCGMTFHAPASFAANRLGRNYDQPSKAKKDSTFALSFSLFPKVGNSIHVPSMH